MRNVKSAFFVEVQRIMTLRDRLIKLQETGQLVRLFGYREEDYYICRILKVGYDYLEMEAFWDGDKWGEVLMVLADVRRVEVYNVYAARDELQRLYDSMPNGPAGVTEDR